MGGPVYSLEKTLMLGKIEGKRRRAWQRMSWLESNQLEGHESLQTLGDRGAWSAAVEFRLVQLSH